MTYPSTVATTIKYTAGTAADLLSRPDLLALGATDEVAYRYLGFGSVVGVTYLATGGSTPVHMTYENGGTGPGGDRYSGLDSFGRVVETLWKMGIVVKQNASYGYDRSSNRQWRRDDLAHDLGGVEATRHDNVYWYDGLYQVKERKLGNLIGTAPAYTGIDIIHDYDPSWRAVEEYRNSDTAPERRYLWGLRSRWDLVKRERDDSGSLDEKRYVLYDAMDPVAICNASGTVTQRFEYSPFGEASFMDGNFAPDASRGDWNWLFHGEFRDRDTGYYNYGHRFYNPTTGRWRSRDPIEERGGVNLYGFVWNNGIKHFDLLGLRNFRGPFDSRDRAGYYASRWASMLTQKSDNVREYCGIICCKDKKYWISTPHGGPDRRYQIIDKIHCRPIDWTQRAGSLDFTRL